MLVNRIWFIIITLIMMITLSICTKNTVVAGQITLVTMIVGYVAIAVVRSKKRLNLIEEKCNPQAFIEATERQRNITGKDPKIDAYLSIDKAAGLILMGEFEKAKEVLLSIDRAYLSVKNGTLLIYTINLILCLYQLGEISHAEELFETQVPLLPPVNSKMTQLMKVLVAERFFFLNRFEESKEKFQELLGEKITKRERLGILYQLAQVEDKQGDINAAKEKYQEVSDYGEDLWIAQQARERLENM
jgi:tetratricopeptide (TPR) repeat protein